MTDHSYEQQMQRRAQVPPLPKWFWVGVVCGMIGTMIAVLAGCQPQPKRVPDKIVYSSNVPQIQRQVTTQQAAVAIQQANDRTAKGLVNSADTQVVSVNAEKPDARLATAHSNLVKAGDVLTANDKAQQETIDAQAETIRNLSDHIAADDSLLAQAKAEAKKAADVLTRAEAAEKFIDDHKNDIFGAKVHRIVKAVSWTLIITLAVLAIALGIVGSIYGLPKITAPAATAIGAIINFLRVAAYKAATFIWSAIPIIGHYIDELLNEIGLHRTSGTVTQVVVPTSPTPPLSGSTAPNPVIVDALRKYGVHV